MKINKSKIRREIATKLAQIFIDSGVPYTCKACVFDLRQTALNDAKILLAQGINLSKSNYPFAWVGNMADMFLTDAADIVHNHYYPSKK